MNQTYDVAALRREEFPWADETLYLNHAGIGPIPERVRRALGDYNRVRAAVHRLTDEHLFEVLDRSRELCSRLINAAPEEICLSVNTSYGLNIAALALPLVPGDIVLVSHGEFPANVFPWRELKRRGVTLELVATTPEGWPDEAAMTARMADSRVKVLSISQVQFHTGYHADLAALSRAARATGTYFVVDAIQALGQLPLDVAAIPIDILSCGAQKWLLSPWGSGFTYVRKGLIEQLEPPLAGWTAFQGTEDFSTLVAYPDRWYDDARRFELITLPFQDFHGMNGAVGLLLDLGIAAIRDHLDRINQPLVDWARRRGVRLASPEGPRHSGMICVAPPDPAAAFAKLTEAGVVASLREGAIRLSPHCYNTIEEIGRVADLLDRSIA